VAVVITKYMRLSWYSCLFTAERVPYVWRSLSIVRTRTTQSNSTDDPNEIGFHTAVGCSWQFELNAVGGPVSARYVDAVEN
jgi:hypothetical protein